nr:hypothetical protein [Burkholderia multivorans]
MGETWMGLAIGGSALTVALTVAIALHWLERRRARRLRDFDHHDCWLVAYGKCIVRRPATRAARARTGRDRAIDDALVTNRPVRFARSVRKTSLDVNVW